MRVIIRNLFKVGTSKLNVSHKGTSSCQIGEFNERQNKNGIMSKILVASTSSIRDAICDSCVNWMEKGVLHFLTM